MTRTSATAPCNRPRPPHPQALRLFSGVPVWTPINRPADEHPSRTKYLSAVAAA